MPSTEEIRCVINSDVGETLDVGTVVGVALSSVADEMTAGAIVAGEIAVDSTTGIGACVQADRKSIRAEMSRFILLSYRDEA
jgi:hypothetical protein